MIERNYNMEITDVRLRRLNPDGKSKMKAVFSVTFDNEFVVHDIRVIENNGKLFCAMPSRRKNTAQAGEHYRRPVW